MRNLLALTAFTVIGALSWLVVAPQNASACDCIGPMNQLELREVILVESNRTVRRCKVQLISFAPWMIMFDLA